LRSSEFLWQEGHTAHASAQDASAYARKIHTEVYNDFILNVLAIPTFLGIKPPSERFAGATNTMTCEGMMKDGKALQMATSHELGQNFAKAFDIVFQSDAGESAHCYTTSWGSSTRMVGGLIMAHGDDRGLVIPPRLAPTQVIVMAVRDGDEAVDAACEAIVANLDAAEVRVSLDRGRGSFGRRVTDIELKGFPLRVEVGPRDLAEGVVNIVRRDTGEKSLVALGDVVATSMALLEAIQTDLLAAALQRRDNLTVEVTTVEEAISAAQTGFARVSWDLVRPEIEKQLKGEALTVRCLQRADGSMPDNEKEAVLTCIIAKSY
jgi:prolyl-tRNA synthetase